MSEDNNMPSHHGDDDHTTRICPNETMRLLLERSSCRSFHDKKIPDELLELILNAGTHAPTGGNLQPFSIIRIVDGEVKKKLAYLCGDQNFIATAPVNLLFCIDWHRLHRWAEIEKAPFAANNSFHHFWISFQDTIIAAQNICIAADALGLGSVYIGTVTECFPELRTMFELPSEVFPVVLLCIGYPKNRPKPKRKLAIDVIAHKDKYRRLTDDEIVDAFKQKYEYHGVEITNDRLAELDRVCCRIGGPELARACLAEVDRRGIVNVAQRYFGLHYTADLMAEGNDQFLRLMEESGFGWFEKYSPPGQATDRS